MLKITNDGLTCSGTDAL